MTSDGSGKPVKGVGGPPQVLVDADGDNLDDRLVDPGSREDASVRAIVRRVRGITLGRLPLDILTRMLTDVDSAMGEKLHNAQQLEQRLHGDILAGDPSTLRIIRRDIRAVGREHGLLEQERERINHALQQRVVDDGMASKLGSPGRAKSFEIFILALIVAVLGLLTYEQFNEKLSMDVAFTIFYIDIGCCCVFLLDFFLRLSCASNKAWFWQHNWIDFVTSIPIPSAQVVRYGRAFRVLRLFRVLRSFRVLRMLRLLRVVRAFRVFLKLFRGMEKLEQVLDVRMMKKSLRWLFGIMALGAAVIYSLEGHMATPVGSAAESAWWSFTTVVTGGFGDLHNPVTGWGRMLTVLLIVSGMIVVGVFTATLTSVYMAEENEALQIRQESLERTLANIQASNEQSRQDMAEMMSRLDGPGGE